MVFSFNVYSAYGLASVAVFGRVLLCYLVSTKSDYATFSPLDNKNITNYSLAQAPDGTTYLNAPTNKDIVFNTNDTHSFYMRDTTLYSAAAKTYYNTAGLAVSKSDFRSDTEKPSMSRGNLMDTTGI